MINTKRWKDIKIRSIESGNILACSTKNGPKISLINSDKLIQKHLIDCIVSHCVTYLKLFFTKYGQNYFCLITISFSILSSTISGSLPVR